MDTINRTARTNKALAGRVAVVFGATRSAGRGIGEELALAGATVYCAGRSTAEHPHADDPRTSVDATVARITRQGGEALPAYADATQADQVAALFERIRRERARLDILANSIWRYGTEGWARPFWEQDKDAGFALILRTAHAHIIPLIYAIPLMAETEGQTLLVTISDVLGIGLYDDLGHIMQHRIAESLRVEAARGKVDITAVTLVSSWLRTEEMLQDAGVTEENWPDACPGDKDWLRSQTPRYTGRAVVALATDPDAKRHTGQTREVGDLAQEYEFTDVDGRQLRN